MRNCTVNDAPGARPNEADKTGLSAWRLSDVRFENVARRRVRDDEALFFVLASSSLVESGTDVYTRVLVEHFREDTDLTRWLEHSWRQDELRHGLALRSYVAAVWPEFDWQAAFDGFSAEYSACCTAQALEPTPALELVARCMIETGTASLYKAVGDYTDEPVLKQLCGLIRGDEARHYQRFLQHYVAARRDDPVARRDVLRALTRRLVEIDSEDADCALRHVFRQRYPRHAIDSALFRRVTAEARALVANHLPSRMVVKMAIRPLDLPPRLQHCLVPPVAGAIRLVARGRGGGFAARV